MTDWILEHPWLTIVIGVAATFAGVIAWVYGGACVHWTGAWPISPAFIITCRS